MSLATEASDPFVFNGSLSLVSANTQEAIAMLFRPSLAVTHDVELFLSGLDLRPRTHRTDVLPT